MPKTALLALSLTAALAIVGCSRQTQENAQRTAESAGEDVGGAAAKASDALDNAAGAVGKAAGEAADSASVAADRMGDKIKQGANDARERVHEETAPKKER
jgi:hypothetical protein